MTAEENEQIHATLTKMNAETAKLLAETSKINTEARYHPLVVGAALMAAATGVAGLLIKAFGG